MKKDKRRRSSNRKMRLLSLLITIAMISSLLPLLSGAVLAVGEPGSVSVTKKEMGAGGQQLPVNKVTTRTSTGSSTTMGNKVQNGVNTSSYNVASGHFAFVEMDINAVRQAPLGVDYDLVHGADFTKIGTANVRINSDDKIVFTLNNYQSNGGWGLLASDSTFAGGKNPHSGSAFGHDYNQAQIIYPADSKTVTDIDANGDGTIFLYFHNEGTMNIREYSETATPFFFQITKAGGGSVSLTELNIVFRDAVGDVIKDGGGIGQNPPNSDRSSADGYFWLKNGITATICGLPEGSYVITETENDTYITTLNPGGPGNSATLEVRPDGTTEITFENLRVSYMLTVAKEITNPGSVPVADANDEFGITVTFTGSSLNIISNDKGFTPSSNYTVWTGRLKAGETVTFSDLSVGTTYVVSEISTPPSYDFASSSSSNLTGTIESFTSSGTYTHNATVANTYVQTEELAFSAIKTVSSTGTGTIPTTWAFNFELLMWLGDEDIGTPGARIGTARTATNAAPTVLFDKIGFRDRPGDIGDHYYLIRETSANGDGWRVDTKQYLIKVTVDNQSGLEVTTEIASRNGATGSFTSLTPYTASAPVNFENRFTPGAARLTLSGRKTVSSGAPTSTFDFTVTQLSPAPDPGDEVVGTGRITGFGSITFSTIVIDEVGDYIFEVAEVPPSSSAWTMNTAPKTIYVRVVQSGSNLVATVYTNPGYSTAITANFLTFDNSFTASPTSMTLKAQKTARATSGSTVPSAWEFVFELYASDSSGNQLARIDDTSATISDPYAIFDDIDIAESTTYFILRETSISENGWTVSNRIYHIQVTAQVDNDGYLSITRIQQRSKTTGSWSSWSNYRDSGSNYTLTFENSYTAPPPNVALLTLSGTKTIMAGAPTNETFYFELYQVDGSGETLVSTTQVTGPGTFTFPEIRYTVADTYEYIIKEVLPTSGNWNPVTPITVIVGVNSGGTWSARAYQSDATTPINADYMTIHNTYNGQLTEPYFDLALTKNVSAVNGAARSGTPTVRIGDKVTYTIRVTNQGTIPGFAVEIVDRLPEGLIFDPADNPGWTYDAGTHYAYTGLLSTTLLAPGESAEITIVLTVSDTVTPGTRLRNIAEINWHSDGDGNWIDDIDSTPGNGNPNEDDEDFAEVIVFKEYDPPDDPKDPEDPEGPKDPEDPEIPEDPKDPEDPENPEDPEITVNPGAPGGRDRERAPNPTFIGNLLEPLDNGGWIEFDEDGTPLGEWRWDEPEEMWVFEEYPPPLAEMPKTDGELISLTFLFLMFCSSLVVVVVVKSYTDLNKQKRSK